MIRLTELKIPVQLVTDDNKEIALLYQLLNDKYKIKKSDVIELSIFKKTIDARKKHQVIYVYSVDLVCRDEQKILSRKYPNCSIATTPNFNPTITGDLKLKHRPLVIV